MRKITEQITSAFIAGSPLTNSNTSTDGKTLFLHGNPIAGRDEKGMWISNCGWFSMTTKERLNGLPGVTVHQEKGKWYLNGTEWDGMKKYI
jgi:hypothetical protein